MTIREFEPALQRAAEFGAHLARCVQAARHVAVPDGRGPDESYNRAMTTALAAVPLPSSVAAAWREFEALVDFVNSSEDEIAKEVAFWRECLIADEVLSKRTAETLADVLARIDWIADRVTDHEEDAVNWFTVLRADVERLSGKDD